MFKFFVQVRPPMDIEAKVSRLNKQATTFKKEKDWVRAVACMKEVFGLYQTGKMNHISPESWARYPIFLQQAGCFSEAMDVFGWLLMHAEEIIKKDHETQPPFIQRGYVHHFRSGVYSKMRVACTREKIPDDAKRFAALAAESDDLFWKFRDVLDLHEARERLKYERRKADRFRS